jgi:hypothetical protein
MSMTDAMDRLFRIAMKSSDSQLSAQPSSMVGLESRSFQRIALRSSSLRHSPPSGAAFLLICFSVQIGSYPIMHLPCIT